jgi:hypothetical protein
MDIGPYGYPVDTVRYGKSFPHPSMNRSERKPSLGKFLQELNDRWFLPSFPATTQTKLRLDVRA